eukprot:5064549-Lingulodinium_polyedra.AAC.1
MGGQASWPSFAAQIPQGLSAEAVLIMHCHTGGLRDKARGVWKAPFVPPGIVLKAPATKEVVL